MNSITWKNLARKLIDIPNNAEIVKNEVAEAVAIPPAVPVTAFRLLIVASETIAFFFLS